MTPIRPSLKGVFPKVFLPFYGDVSLGNYTQFKIALSRLPEGFLLVGIVGKGCYPFMGRVHPDYLSEKMPGLMAGDAGNVADFLNCQLGYLSWVGAGRYDAELCSEMSDEDE